MNNGYIGHPDQLMTVQQGVLTQGKQNGVRFIDISNGAGLELTVLADRCMDIYQVRFDGKNLAFINPCGIVHPSYFARSDEAWFGTFTAGFLTTCGLTTIGVGAEENGVKLNLHGVIGNMPATQVNVERGESDGVPFVKLTGEMSENMLGYNMTLTREITIRHGVNEIELRDTVTNLGHKTAPHMILYHCNMGYPLLSENAVIEINSSDTRGRTAHAQDNIDKWRIVQKPQTEFEEICFYHNIIPGADGLARAAIKNSAEHIGVEVRYDPRTLDRFVQWSMFQKGTYVVGLEPCNGTIDGRDDARRNGSLKQLDPGESVTHSLVFDFLRV